MSDPVLGPTEVWDLDALIEVEKALLIDAGRTERWPSPIRCRTGAIPGTKGTSRKVLHFLLTADKAEDGVPQLYISPLVDDSDVAIRLLTRMAIELTWPPNRHHPSSNPWAADVYFDLNWNSRTPVPVDSGSRMERLIPQIIRDLGPRPHGKPVLAEQVRTPKTTALLKAWCPYCREPSRLTLSALKKAWPVCVGAKVYEPTPDPNGLAPITNLTTAHGPVFLFAQSNGVGVLQAPTAGQVDANGYPCP